MRQRQPQLLSYMDAVDQLDIVEGLNELLLAYETLYYRDISKKNISNTGGKTPYSKANQNR